uniref:Glutathione peroxidase 1 n=1 Tax=Esox lucius TaxID=8010 RepID=A0AAY5KZ22_ESOLU
MIVLNYKKYSSSGTKCTHVTNAIRLPKFTKTFSKRLLEAVAASTRKMSTSKSKKFYDLAAKLLTGEPFNFASLQNKVVLIENVMNELHERYADKGLVILGVPCNQFGHQVRPGNEEILMSLKYVRPGNGFEPKFQLLEKVDVNGKDAHPLFVYLKENPVCRNDISWNFEKFLIGPDGEPFKRYSRSFLTSNIEGDIKKLLDMAK